MKGIYKITNKLNGKSYIGQSIHCGKRLDEHLIGDQYIDNIIKQEGIKNFTFEILQEVSCSSQLSYWEDFYIHKFNSLYPNGYNRRLNTKNNYSINSNISDKEQDKLISEKSFYQKILRLNKKTDFYDQVLIFLLYEKNDISIKKISFLLGKNINKKQIENTIRLLYKEGLIIIDNNNNIQLSFEADELSMKPFFCNVEQIFEMRFWESKIFFFSIINNIMGYKVNEHKCYKFFEHKYDKYNKNIRFFKNILLEVKCKYSFLNIE